MTPLASWSLYDGSGARKYLTETERAAFMAAAKREAPMVETFCLALAYTGARISEVLALTPERIDPAAGVIVVETLKKRKKGVFRAIPVPDEFFVRLEAVHGISALQADPAKRTTRLWPSSRTAAWGRVKRIMRTAGIAPARAMPKALRHAFGVGGTTAGVPLNLIQRWMGHSSIATTAIYANAVGEEERRLAGLMWARAKKIRPTASASRTPLPRGG